MVKLRNCFKGFLMIVLFASLVGCVGGWKYVSNQGQTFRHRIFSGNVPQGWFLSNGSSLLMLTKRGLGLESITIKRFKTSKELMYSKEKLADDMTIYELSSAIADNLKLCNDIHHFKLVSMSPVKLGDVELFRTHVEYDNKDDSHKIVIIYGFIYKKVYYEITYSALKGYYDEEARSVFDQFVAELSIDLSRAELEPEEASSQPAKTSAVSS